MTSMRGTTAECLADFLSRDNYDWNAALLAKFTRVNTKSVARWRRQGAHPNGDELVCVRVFLDLQGYNVEEFSNVPDITRDTARIIAFGIMNTDDVRLTLEYKNSQDVYRVILRGAGLTTTRSFLLRQMAEAYATEIVTRRTEWQQIIASEEPITFEENSVVTTVSSATPGRTTPPLPAAASSVATTPKSPPRLPPSDPALDMGKRRPPVARPDSQPAEAGPTEAEFMALSSSVLALVWALRGIHDRDAVAKRLRTAVPLDDLKVIQSFLSRAISR